MSDDSSLAQVFQIYSNLFTHVDSPFGIKWVSSSCKSLGIYIGNSNTNRENFDDRSLPINSGLGDSVASLYRAKPL